MSSTGSSNRVTRHSGGKRKHRRNKRRFSFRRLLMPFFVLLVGAGIGVGCFQLLTTPSLDVREIQVRGTRLLVADVVKKDVSGAIGQNIISLSTRKLRTRVALHPEVKTVHISRRLPKGILVRVEERAARFNVTNGSGWWLADSDGLPFHRVSVPVKRIATVQLPQGAVVVPGKKVSHPGLENAMKCIQASGTLASKITKISVDRAGNLCLNIGSDFYVKLGQPVEIPQKMRELGKILAAQPEIGERVEYINVSCYQAPALKLKPAADEKPAENT